MTMSGDMAETSVTDLFTLPKLGRVLTHGPGGNWCLYGVTRQTC